MRVTNVERLLGGWRHAFSSSKSHSYLQLLESYAFSISTYIKRMSGHDQRDFWLICKQIKRKTQKKNHFLNSIIIEKYFPGQKI